MDFEQEKVDFSKSLKEFAETLNDKIAINNEWTIKGFIDVFKIIHTISQDTKVISKVLELQLFPYFLEFAQYNGYDIELASNQNWYPDMTFVKKDNPSVKFAVDLKTTYRDENNPEFCRGFTLGSHGEYFVNQASTKNVQYPYGSYAGHFCLGIIYVRSQMDKIEEMRAYSVEELGKIPSAIHSFLFFAEEKWRIASDKGGSGNTANIGSIEKINDLLNGNGVFAKAGEELFDDYWSNYGKIEIPSGGTRKKLSSFKEYLAYRQLPANLYNPKANRKNVK